MFHLLKPQAALGATTLQHPLVQLSFVKAKLESPRPASSQHRLLPVVSPALQGAGHQGQPHCRAGGASAGPETALSPPCPWGPPHQDSHGPLVDPSFSLLCLQCWTRGAGRLPTLQPSPASDG